MVLFDFSLRKSQDERMSFTLSPLLSKFQIVEPMQLTKVPFSAAIVIYYLRLRRSDILFALDTREANTTRQKPNITAKQYNSSQANRTEKSTCICKCFFLVGAGGFGPPKSETTDLQSAPFGHSGTLPYSVIARAGRWSWWTDSNPRPADYKSAALPAELHQRVSHATPLL